MSLQNAILKVLVSHPEGRATIAALNSDLSILYTSGSDWIDRLKRLAARAPALDIFGQRLVLRESSGWQITPEVRARPCLLRASATSVRISAQSNSCATSSRTWDSNARHQRHPAILHGGGGIRCLTQPLPASCGQNADEQVCRGCLSGLR